MEFKHSEKEVYLRKMSLDLLMVDLDPKATKECIVWVLNELEHLRSSVLLEKNRMQDLKNKLHILLDY